MGHCQSCGAPNGKCDRCNIGQATECAPLPWGGTLNSMIEYRYCKTCYWIAVEGAWKALGYDSTPLRQFIEDGAE